MHFNSNESGAEQQRDGRLTIVLLLVFLLLLLLLGHQKLFQRNKNNYKYLDVTLEKQLYLKQEEKITHRPESLPLCYYPFFFLSLPINSADKELLMTIKGIGPALAETIIVHRQKVGPILNIGDFQEIPGIGRKRATSLAAELVFDKGE
jgi:competence ComEA-like helix-hairpin-helix protein